MKASKGTAAVMGFVLLGASTAFAEEPKKDASKDAAVPAAQKTISENTNKTGYGMAGCGLGSLLFGAKPGFVQVFAATTNSTFGSQTFGISTGTSNCVDTNQGATSARAFIQANREALAKDVARGSGETLASLTSIAGCADSKAVSSTLQKNFKRIFPTSSVSSDQVTDSVLSTLKSDQTLACGRIG